MINMDAFKQPISGEIEFTVLDVIEKDIPKKEGTGFHEVIELTLSVKELEGSRTDEINTLIFKSTDITSSFYKFAVSVNKVYEGTDGLENLINATGRAKLYYYKGYANLGDWIFYQKSEKTKEALDMYTLEAGIHQDEDSVKANPFIQSNTESYPKNIFSNSTEVTSDDIDLGDI